MITLFIYLLTILLGLLGFYFLNEDCRKLSQNIVQRAAGLIKYYTFSWFTPALTLGKYEKLENLFLLDEGLSTTNSYALFKSEWRKQVVDYNNNVQLSPSDRISETTKPPPSLLITLYSIFGKTFRGSLCLKLLTACLEFGQPYLLSCIIKELSDSSASVSNLLLYSILLFVDMEALSLLENAYMDIMGRMGIQVQSCLISAVYEKMLFLSSAERQKRSIGEIVNLMSTDIENFQKLTPQIQLFVSGPLKIIFTLIYLYILIGSSAIPGILIILLFFPLNAICSRKLKTYIQQQKKVKDDRIKGINEILTNMQTIKINVLENVMYKRIDLLREKELELTRRSVYLRLIVDSYNISAPFVVPLVSFGILAYTQSVSSLSMDVILVCMTLFKQLKGPLQRLANLINVTTQAVVSNARLCSFLTADELNSLTENGLPTDEALKMNDLQTSWPNNSQFSLNVKNLVIRKGQLIVVSGKVGSGKTSFLSSILGVMEKSSGHCHISGAVGYVSQQAWIRNSTIRENILFGSPYESDRYQKIVHCCGLDIDLAKMTANDLIIAGHQGSNLSGGQQSRISLARALYQECDIYLLDDPLAAIDSRVSEHIINKLFGAEGYLKNRTVVIVTHNKRVLKLADVVLDICYGVVHIKKMSASQRNDGITNETTENRVIEKQEERIFTKPNVEIKKTVPTKDESSFLFYVKSASLLHWAIFISLFMFFNYVQYLGNLKITALAQNLSQPSSFYYLILYGMFQLVMFIASSSALIWCTDCASRTLHQTLLRSILNGKMNMIGTQLGEIANTCSKDIDSVDFSVPPNIKNIVTCFLQVFITLFGVFNISPTFIMLLFPLGVFYYNIVRDYVPASKHFRTMMSATKSKIYYHFSESINGGATISAFHKEDDFARQSALKVNSYIQWKYSSILCNRWLSIRLDLIGSSLVFLTALGAVFAKCMGSETDTAVIGVCLTYGINLTEVLSYSLKQLSNLQSKIHSVERISMLSQLFDEKQTTRKQTKISWPAEGSIKFKSFSARYNSDQSFILRNIDLKILPGEKVGIIGRTGSGKSSFIMSILKMIDEVCGTIEIDGVSIENMSVNQLRGSITVISQNPIMFSGSIRSNIDPHNKFNDETIWQALSRAHLTHTIEKLPGGLDHDCSTGSDLSVGQKQLLALAGALLKKNKILILDEATSALDDKTEHLIQKTIDDHFGDHTVLSIAHRLKTVENCDRVLLIKTDKLFAMLHQKKSFLISHKTVMLNYIATLFNH